MPQQPDNCAPSGVLRSTSTLAALTALSRGMGFLRDFGIAAILGAGPMADAFLVAFRIPNLLRRLFGEGTLSLAFVPAFNHLRHAPSTHHDSFGRASAMARSAMAWTLLISGGACLLFMLFPAQLARLLAPGFADDAAQLATAASMLRICAPYAVFIMAAAVSMGVLNSMGRFTTSAVAHIALNSTLLVALLLALLLDSGDDTRNDAAWLLAWAVPIAGALQLLIQQPALAKLGFSWFGGFSMLDRAVAKLGREVPPAIVGASTLQITGLLATLFATLLPAGAVSWLYFADRLVQLPLGVFGAAVSTVALPHLAALSAQARSSEFDEVLARGLALVLFVSLPATAGLMALAEPIVALLFGHGAFDDAAVKGAAGVLMALAPGLPAFAAVKPLCAACCARQEAAGTWKAGIAGVVVFLVLAWPCLKLLGAPGLGAAMAAAGWCNALLLLATVRRHSLRSGLVIRQLRGTAVLAGGVFALATAGRMLCPWPQETAALVLVPLLAMGYMLAAHALGIEAAREAWRLITRCGKEKSRA